MKIHTFVTDVRDPRARGGLIGERWAQEIRQTVSLYLDFFPKLGLDPQRVRALGEASIASLEAWAPDLADEIHAMADGAGVPRWQLASLNARTEILAIAPPSAEGECSTTVYAPAGPDAPRTLQTWDWHDSLALNGLLLQFATRGGRTVKLFTEFGMPAKIGVNSAGLGLHFNILHHASDDASAGVPVHAIARRVLEEAATVREAIDIARSARVSASTVLTVFQRDDAHPRAACIEMSPAGTAIVTPRPDGWLLHTNHFLDRALGEGECMPDSSTTRERFAHLTDAVPGMTSADARARARALCGDAGDQAVVCFHPDPSMPDTERWETLLTVGVDTGRCELQYVAGNPNDMARNGFSRF